LIASPWLKIIAIALARNSIAKINRLSYNMATSCLSRLAGGHSEKVGSDMSFEHEIGIRASAIVESGVHESWVSAQKNSQGF
jgi:hypothetical protein